MRRTNKRHKKQNNIKKRKTLKKRFSKRGGKLEKCEVCGEKFDIRSLYDSRFENHKKTHPICTYCKAELKDINALIEHLCDGKIVHPEMPNACKLANDIKYDDGSNLIDKLRNNDTTIIGSLPELTTFYDKIKAKQKSIERKEADKRKKEENAKAEEARRLARETAKEEEAAKRLARERAKLEEEEAKKAKAEEIRETNRLAKERAIAKKAEQERLLKEKQQQEQQEQIARKLEVKSMGIEDKVAKGIEKQTRTELASMGAEDKNVPEVNQKLIEANTVEDAIEIIESASKPTVSKVPTVPVQNINLRSRSMLSEDEFRIIKLPTFQGNITYGMTSLFPVTKCFSEEINNLTNKEKKFNEYKMINNLILFLVGLFNYKFIQNNIDIKMIIKGGKGAQMILSAYDFYNININRKNKVKCDITSDDIDILLVQENGYNRETLYSVAKQFANLVKDIIDEKYTENELISIREPIPDAFNPNIFKISYINKTEPNKTKYNVASDIDIKQVESDFFNINNIEGIGFPNEFNLSGLKYNYGKVNFELRYWLQSPQAFLAEKQYYLSIYNNIINSPFKVYDKDKNKEIDCDCKNLIKSEQPDGSFNPNYSFECTTDCNHAKIMLPKFQKYITPFQELVNMLNNQNNFAGHYSL